MLNNKDFYPTPDTLITKMLEGINLYAIKTILEPSAGDGNIVNYVNNRIKNTLMNMIYLRENILLDIILMKVKYIIML